jgi:hypothetical protein
MSNREHMGTEQFETEWNGRRETLYDRAPSWNLKLAGYCMVAVVSFAAGVALEDQMVEGQKRDEALAFAFKVRACETDPNAGTAVARRNGKIECHALMPRFMTPLESKPRYPSRRELRRILRISQGAQ